MKKVIFCIIFITFIISCGKDAENEPGGGTIVPGTALFSDDYNRVNSTSVGNGWTETELHSSTAAISSNQLVLSGGWYGDEPIAASVIIPLNYSGSFKITLDFRIDSKTSFTPTFLNGTNSYFFFISTVTGANYFFINSIPSSVSMLLDSKTDFTTFNPMHDYTAVITKVGSTISLSITDKSSGITLTGTCSDGAYSSFTHFALTGGGNVSGAVKSTYVDDVLIESI